VNSDVVMYTLLHPLSTVVHLSSCYIVN